MGLGVRASRARVTDRRALLLTLEGSASVLTPLSQEASLHRLPALPRRRKAQNTRSQLPAGALAALRLPFPSRCRPPCRTCSEGPTARRWRGSPAVIRAGVAGRGWISRLEATWSTRVEPSPSARAFHRLCHPMHTLTRAHSHTGSTAELLLALHFQPRVHRRLRWGAGLSPSARAMGLQPPPAAWHPARRASPALTLAGHLPGPHLSSYKVPTSPGQFLKGAVIFFTNAAKPTRRTS